MKEGAQVCSIVADPRIVVVVSHGLSENHTGAFMELLIRRLIDELPAAVVAYESSYYRCKGRPSADLSLEVSDIEHMLAAIPQVLSGKRRVLVGKSLGAVASLAYAARVKDPCLDAVVALGLPSGLGFPPDLALLRYRVPRKPMFDVEYRALFDALDVPVIAIQGDRDDLCDLERLNDALGFHARGVVDVVPGADHGFIAEDGSRLWEVCVERLVSHLMGRIE